MPICNAVEKVVDEAMANGVKVHLETIEMIVEQEEMFRLNLERMVVRMVVRIQKACDEIRKEVLAMAGYVVLKEGEYQLAWPGLAWPGRIQND